MNTSALTHQLSPRELKALQQCSLEIYRVFADYCHKHNLRFWACGGSCIGAVRHQGFIPWDDDIDVFMPRPDYERLQQIWREDGHPRYNLILTHDDMLTGDLMLKLGDEETTLVLPYQQHRVMPQCITLDILALDGSAKPGTFARKLQKLWALLFSLFYSQLIPVNHGKVVEFGSRALLACVPSNKVRLKLARWFERKMTQYPFDESDYITELCSGPHYMQNEFNAEWFKRTIQLPFEGMLIDVMEGYHHYLSMAFGDYLKLPPQEQQVPHHVLTKFNPDVPYYQEFPHLRAISKAQTGKDAIGSR